MVFRTFLKPQSHCSLQSFYLWLRPPRVPVLLRVGKCLRCSTPCGDPLKRLSQLPQSQLRSKDILSPKNRGTTILTTPSRQTVLTSAGSIWTQLQWAAPCTPSLFLVISSVVAALETQAASTMSTQHRSKWSTQFSATWSYPPISSVFIRLDPSMLWHGL